MFRRLLRSLTASPLPPVLSAAVAVSALHSTNNNNDNNNNGYVANNDDPCRLHGIG